jgi:hypothetical protein
MSRTVPLPAGQPKVRWLIEKTLGSFLVAWSHAWNSRFVRPTYIKVTLSDCQSAMTMPEVCYAKTPSNGFQRNATLLHPVGIHFGFLNVADFKGIRAGQHFQ